MKQLISHLRTLGTPTLYRKGSNVFFQGEVPRYGVVILDGVIKAYTINPDGEEVIVHLFGKGSILPVSWLNSQSSTALFNYDAVNDVRALKVRKTDFHDAIASNHEFALEYLDQVTKAHGELLLRITGLSQSRATEKICYTLYYLLFRYGIERTPNTYEINLKLTQSMLANLIGQTRESTAKNLKHLKDIGVVDYTSSSYTVNKQKLESYLGEDSFRNLEL